jgi:hypothetical protein
MGGLAVPASASKRGGSLASRTRAEPTPTAHVTSGAVIWTGGREGPSPAATERSPQPGVGLLLGQANAAFNTVRNVASGAPPSRSG